MRSTNELSKVLFYAHNELSSVNVNLLDHGWQVLFNEKLTALKDINIFVTRDHIC